MRPSLLLAGVLAVLAGFGCGGTAVTGGESLPPATDASPQDGGQDASKHDAPVVGPDGWVGDAQIYIDAAPEAAVDVPPAEFCSGAAKIDLGGNVLQPTLTTSPVIMDCCDGVTVRFHVKQWVGYNVSVVVRAFGLMEVGAYVLGDEPGEMEVSARKEFDFDEWSPATGTLHVDSKYPDPVRVGFCLEAPATDVLPAMRMYVPQVLVAPYDWEKNWSIYLLSDPGIAATDALKQPIGGLALASEPIVHLMSIAYYEQSTHKAIWDNWYNTQTLLNSLPKVGLQGLPFVVVAGSERIYVGAFTTPVSSIMVDAPSIDTSSIPEEGFTIQPPPSPPDPRADARILKVLGEGMKLAP